TDDGVARVAARKHPRCAREGLLRARRQRSILRLDVARARSQRFVEIHTGFDGVHAFNHTARQRNCGTAESRGFIIAAMARTVDDLPIDAIRERYLAPDKPVSPHILKRLQRDPRQGARKLYQSLKKRYEQERKESLRLQAMRHFELVLWKSGVR